MGLPSRRQQAAELIRGAQILGSRGFLPATDGNLSARLAGGRVLITRAGIEKRDLCARSFVDVSLRDERPGDGSSEWPLHRALYLCRDDVNAVLHVHAPCLTAFAVTHRVPSDDLLVEAARYVGEIALVPFRQPGSHELADALPASSRTAGIYLLANHGVVVVGTSVREAFHRLERAELLAEVELYCAVLGNGVPIAKPTASPASQM